MHEYIVQNQDFFILLVMYKYA